MAVESRRQPLVVSPPLAYSRDGRGPHLLLLHGGVGSRNHWARNIPALARRFTVTAVDLPGYGASPDVPRNIDADGYLAIVAEAARALCGIRFYLCGFSFGAVVAAATAATLRAEVAALSLIAPGGFGAPAGRRLDLRTVPRRDIRCEEARSALRHNLRVTMLADPAAADDATLELHQSNVQNARFDSRRISLQERLIADLRRIACPLQAIWGARDQLAYPSIAERAGQIKAIVPEARLDIIPNGGHWIQYESPADTNRALLDFLCRAP